MAIDETPGSYGLHVDRGYPCGLSLGPDDRLALHTKVKNLITEPVPVFIVNTSPESPQVVVAPYTEITSVPSSTPTTLITYIVPPAKTFLLQRIDVGGSNIATYDAFIDATQIGKRRTWFAEGLSSSFLFVGQPEMGLVMTEGQALTVVVTHNRPDVGDFESTVQGVLIG